MLFKRVVTAVILLLVLLPAMFYPDARVLAAVLIVPMAAAGWEWARLNGLNKVSALGSGVVCAVICLIAWAMDAVRALPSGIWWGAGVLWILGGGAMLVQGPDRWGRIPVWVRVPAGIAMLVLAWLAAAQARTVGVNFLLSVLVLVWAADIAAYFAGRAWGTRLIERRLAPSISPGKSWEGVLGGVAGVLLLSVAWIWMDRYWSIEVPSLYSRLYQAGGWIVLIPMILLLTGMSVVGDLVESLVKRAAGMKDSSGLLPGHGGVLDRADALLPVLPLAMACIAWVAQS